MTRGRFFAVFLPALALLMGSLAFAITASVALSALQDEELRLEEAIDSARAEQRRLTELASRQAAEAADEQARLDAHYEEQGWTTTGTAGLYMKWVEGAQCGYWNCAPLALFAAETECSSNLYVEANIISNGAVVGFTNEMLAALPRGQGAVVVLEDHTGYNATSFELTQISCT